MDNIESAATATTRSSSLEPARFLELLGAVAVAANEASTVTQAAQACLEDVCNVTGWPVGRLYLLSKEPPYGLEPTTTWHLADTLRFDAFRKAMATIVPGAGDDISGRVLATGNAAWIANIEKEPAFTGAEEARQAGICSALAFPITAGAQVVGVLEFFGAETVEPDEPLLKVMLNIGNILGRVAEREQAEEAVAHSENRFRLLFELASDGIALYDRPGRILEVNSRMCEMLGYSREELLAMTVRDVIAPEDLAKIPLRTTEMPPGVAVVGERILVRKDGIRVPTELTARRLENGSIQTVVRDVSERKMVEEEIRQLNRDLERRVTERTTQLEQAVGELKLEIAERRRLEQQKDEFIAVASHELRTPITAIKGYVQIALREAEQSGQTRLARLLKTVNEKTNQVTRLISEMLDVSRVENNVLPLEQEEFDLRLLARDVASSAEMHAEGFSISLDLPPAPIMVYADRQRVEQVLSNLVDNAIKYAGKDQLDSRGGRRTVEVSAMTAEGEALVSVRDYGVGIPEDQQSRVFSRFFRADNVTHARYPYPGLGLGLYISHEIVDRHKGRMWLTSTEGVGSTFYFTLPLAAPDTQAVTTT